FRHERRLTSYLFFFNDTPTSDIYTLSLHDALPICEGAAARCERRPSSCRRSKRETLRCSTRPIVNAPRRGSSLGCTMRSRGEARDRKSTRLNSSHVAISYAVFCLKKKKL